MKIKVQNSGINYLKPGIYLVECKKATIEKDDKNGMQYVQFEFGNPDGIQNFRNYINGKDNNYYLGQTLKALMGLESDVEEIDFDTSDLVGKMVIIQVKPDTYTTTQGEVKNVGKIESIMSANDKVAKMLLKEFQEKSSDDVYLDQIAPTDTSNW